jgi:hypothetical protein
MEEVDRQLWREGRACSRISGIVSGLGLARADMESANHAAPIATSGKRGAAGRVIGVKRSGGDPVCHDGPSISTQGSG